ncbi:MAG: PEGA domain-containing protein [Polyangiaceae bacterium]
MGALRSFIFVCAMSCVLATAGNGAAQSPAKEPAAHAQPKPDLGEPEAVAKERARLLYAKGVTAYREARFYDAVDIFLETNRLYPDPKFSYNIGKAFEGMANQPSALRYYREYLRRLPDAPDAREVEGHVHQLELALSQKGIQQLTVLSTPDGAVVRLDGQAVGVTPWTGESFAGKHRAVLEAVGYQRLESVLELDPHSARDFAFALVKTASVPVCNPLAAVKPPVREAKVSVFTMSTLGAALALFGTAVIAQVASSNNSTGISKTSAFLAGTGTGVSLVGGVMLYFDLSPGSSSGASSAVHFNTDQGLQHGMSQ